MSKNVICDGCGLAVPITVHRQQCPRCQSWVDGQYVLIGEGSTLPPAVTDDPEVTEADQG